ncbi:MAG: hypothetical protein DRP64_17885, partial [Verrucomicrobia bacterium]
MDTKRKKRFFTNHSKSSAMVVSLALHAVLLVVALSFVAVTVVTKDDKKFESRQVNRPRMPPKKLQVPVKIKKQKRKPKLRKRIVVNPTINRNMPDIKMPEISGIKGGMGAAGAGGLGSVAGIGFTMPEIEVFGVKSKGEKVFLVLDSREFIMYDEVGGIAGYTIIKDELVRILDGLPPTTLFNIAVFDTGGRFVLFPNMVPANTANVVKVGKWLDPLNKVSAGMKADDFGPKTLGPGGHRISENFSTGKIHKNQSWYPPCAEAMKQQADTVFLLTSIFGWQYDGGERIPMGKSAQKRWDESYQKALKLLDEDNKNRLAKGEAPRALKRTNKWDLNKAYFPDIEFPRHEEVYWYTPNDFREAFETIRAKYKPATTQARSGIVKNKKKDKFT